MRYLGISRDGCGESEVASEMGGESVLGVDNFLTGSCFELRGRGYGSVYELGDLDRLSEQK